ncbi:MAG: hypothetical protein ACHP91_00910 [Burkholderiales bacterium]
MDTSSPPPDAPPAPREATLTTMAEQVAAIDEIVGYARTRLQVFDIDMGAGGWHRAARLDALGRFLRGSRTARCEIILHDLRWLESASGRLLALLRQFPHAVTIYRTGREAREAMDPLVIVDRQHCLHRFHVDQPRASLMVAQPAAIRPWALRFDEIWSTGEPGLSATVLGL